MGVKSNMELVRERLVFCESCCISWTFLGVLLGFGEQSGSDWVFCLELEISEAPGEN